MSKRIDYQGLKEHARIEWVLEQWGCQLEGRERYRTAKNAPGLRVDVTKQVYAWPEREERGDVIEWVKRRWNFAYPHLAANFLEAWLAMPEAERKMLMPPDWLLVIQPLPVVVPVVAAREKVKSDDKCFSDHDNLHSHYGPVNMRDGRVRKALELGQDYPGGFERLFGYWNYEVSNQRMIWPSLFVPLVGDLIEFDYCSGCSREFDPDDWGLDGGYFVEAVVDDEGRISLDGLCVLCAKCVKRFQRWQRALRLASEYLDEQSTPILEAMQREEDLEYQRIIAKREKQEQEAMLREGEA